MKHSWWKIIFRLNNSKIYHTQFNRIQLYKIALSGLSVNAMMVVVIKFKTLGSFWRINRSCKWIIWGSSSKYYNYRVSSNLIIDQTALILRWEDCFKTSKSRTKDQAGCLRCKEYSLTQSTAKEIVTNIKVISSIIIILTKIITFQIRI